MLREGQVRYQTGATPTDYTYTGQRSMMDAFGLMYYNTRWYDPSLGRFARADTLISGAGNPLAWDRYAYGNGNPLRYSDPSGHCVDTPDDDDIGCWKLAQKIADEYGHPYEELLQWNESQLAKLYRAYQERGPLPPPTTFADIADKLEYVSLAIDVLEDPWKIIDDSPAKRPFS